MIGTFNDILLFTDTLIIIPPASADASKIKPQRRKPFPPVCTHNGLNKGVVHITAIKGMRMCDNDTRITGGLSQQSFKLKVFRLEGNVFFHYTQPPLSSGVSCYFVSLETASPMRSIARSRFSTLFAKHIRRC